MEEEKQTVATRQETHTPKNFKKHLYCTASIDLHMQEEIPILDNNFNGYDADLHYPQQVQFI